MEEFRKEIDKCDVEIINLLKKRMSISKKIGIYKKENNLEIYNAEREKKLIDNLKSMQDDLLSGEDIENLYSVILNTSKKIQKNLFNENNKIDL